MGWREQADMYRRDDMEVISSGSAKLLIDEPQTTPSGDTIHILTSKLPLYDQKGSVIGVLGTFTDITERNQMIEALRQSEERFRLAMLGADDGLWDWNLKTDDSDETGRILNVRIVPLGSGTHPLLQIQIRDITKRVKMEEEIQNLNEDLERQVAERTASLQATIADLDSFSYTVSHDLRAPLRTIDGNAHILVMKGGDMITPELHQYIDRIHKSIKKMDNLIDDLLKFSRMSRKPFEKTDIDMNQLVAEVVDELLASDILSHTHVKISQLPGAQGDQTLIRQVLINLISNAIKFGKPGVTNEVTISAQSIEGLVWYCVQDTGIGFDMQYADRIFEVFLQLNPAGSFEGTGVGLAIVKRIIQRHGGRIHVSSQEGEGSTFSFTLDEQYNRENGKQITR